MRKTLTFDQTCQRLGVSRVTLYKIIERGDLTPAFILKIGQQNRKFFYEDDVDELARNRNPNRALEIIQTQLIAN